MLPAGVNLPVLVVSDPVNFSSTAVPVQVGWVEVADEIPVAIVWLEKLGRVTDVGVFAEKLPALQDNVRVSFSTEVDRDGSVQLAAVPALTLPPPLAELATYFVVVDGVTVIVGVPTVPPGV